MGCMNVPKFGFVENVGHRNRPGRLLLRRAVLFAGRLVRDLAHLPLAHRHELPRAARLGDLRHQPRGRPLPVPNAAVRAERLLHRAGRRLPDPLQRRAGPVHPQLRLDDHPAGDGRAGRVGHLLGADPRRGAAHRAARATARGQHLPQPGPGPVAGPDRRLCARRSVPAVLALARKSCLGRSRNPHKSVADPRAAQGRNVARRSGLRAACFREATLRLRRGPRLPHESPVDPVPPVRPGGLYERPHVLDRRVGRQRAAGGEDEAAPLPRTSMSSRAAAVTSSGVPQREQSSRIDRAEDRERDPRSPHGPPAGPLCSPARSRARPWSPCP